MTTSDLDTVRQMAELARLKLDEAEARAYAGQFARILEHFRTLERLPVEGVEPLSGAAGLCDVTRADAPRPGLSTEAALANAPDRREAFYGVPKTIGAAE